MTSEKEAVLNFDWIAAITKRNLFSAPQKMQTCFTLKRLLHNTNGRIDTMLFKKVYIEFNYAFNDITITLWFLKFVEISFI